MEQCFIRLINCCFVMRGVPEVPIQFRGDQMDVFLNYIEKSLPDIPGDDILFAFKRHTLDEMDRRFAEVSERGIDDRKVLEDLIISEHPDLGKEYAEYRRKQIRSRRTKKFLTRNIIGSVIFLISLVAVYLLISFATQEWDMTWVIIADGVLLWVVYLLSVGVAYFSSMRRIFHVFARLSLAGAVIVAMVALYLLVVALTDIPLSWLIVIVGLILMFISDGAFAVIAKHRLAIINWLIYIPVIATFVFIIIGALSLLPWGVAWIIIPLSLIIDLFIILSSIVKNRLEKVEVSDAWNEN